MKYVIIIRALIPLIKELVQIYLEYKKQKKKNEFKKELNSAIAECKNAGNALALNDMLRNARNSRKKT